MQSRGARGDRSRCLLAHLQVPAHESVLLLLLQEACSGPLHDAARTQGAAFADLRAGDLRPVVLRDFKVGAVAVVLSRCGDGAAGVQEVQFDLRVARSTGGRRAGSKGGVELAAELTCCRSPCHGHPL